MLKTQEFSTNMGNETGSVSRKVTSASKTNEGRGDFSLCKDETLFEMIEQQPSTHTLLAEDGLSKSAINQHLHKLSFENRCWNT